MRNLATRVELCTNIAILVLAAILGVVLATNYIHADQHLKSKLINPSSSPEILIGSHFPLAGIDWSKNNTTLVLALQAGCRYCTRSAPFYQQLTTKPPVKGSVQFVAVLPQSVEESRRYLNGLGLTIDNVQHAPLKSIGVIGTPTLLLVDNHGLVVHTWIGELNPNEQAEVLARLHME